MYPHQDYPYEYFQYGIQALSQRQRQRKQNRVWSQYWEESEPEYRASARSTTFFILFKFFRLFAGTLMTLFGLIQIFN